MSMMKSCFTTEIVGPSSRTRKHSNSLTKNLTLRHNVPAKGDPPVSQQQRLVFWTLFASSVRKKSHYVPGSNTRETLLQSGELRSDEPIRRVAQEKLDDRMLAITARDLVVAEAHYHKSCDRKYTRGEKKKTSVAVDKDDEAYEAAEQESYTLLFQYMRDTLFAEPTVLRMTEVNGKLVS